jgi:hypothetical protein
MGNELLNKNLRMYDSLWADARLIEPQRFNTWPLARSLLTESGRRLEVAPGLRPRLPIYGTQFVDVSGPALSQLGERGARVILGDVASVPLASAAFDLVCALDIIEHVENDDGALSEYESSIRSWPLSHGAAALIRSHRASAKYCSSRLRVPARRVSPRSRGSPRGPFATIFLRRF